MPSVEELLARAMRAPAAAPQAAEEIDAVSIPPDILYKNVLDELRFAFWPLWNVERNVISAYACFALVPTGDSGTAYDDAELAVTGNSEDILQLDHALQDRVLAELAAVRGDGRKLLLVLPVHFETLAAAAHRRRYAQKLAELAGDSANLLIVEVTGLPSGVPQSRIVELIAPLRPHCRRVSTRLRAETVDFAPFRGAGVLTVGCDVGSRFGAEPLIIQHLGRFSRGAQKAGFGTIYVCGVPSLSMATAAIGAGFGFVSGIGVAKPVPRPERVLDFTLLDLYRPVIHA